MATATNPTTGRTYEVPEAGADALRALGWEVENDETPAEETKVEETKTAKK